MEITIESVFTHRKELCNDLVDVVGVPEKLLRLTTFAIASAALYGATMGGFHSGLPAAASAVKTPALFLLTLLVCLPALHFVGLLFGSRVRFSQSLVVLMAGVCQTSILLGSFSPISLFFLLSRSEYPFLLMMHVLIFAFCGAAGLAGCRRRQAAPGSALTVLGSTPKSFDGTSLKAGKCNAKTT